MNSNPFKELSEINKLQEQLAKDRSPSADEIKSSTNRFLLLYEALVSNPLPKGSKILELGCGIGDWVAHLNSEGFDAHGVDIQEFWGKDYEHYWKNIEKPSHPYLNKLRKIDVKDYRLPYSDDYFDLIFSDQVIEHVFDIESVLNEASRVLKPSGLQIHKFPGLNGAIERHTMIPITYLTKFKFYVWLWALLGRRTNRQSGLGIREIYETNIDTLKHCNFLSKRTCQGRLSKIGLDVYFVDMLEVKLRKNGRIALFYQNTPKILKPFFLKLINPFVDMVMVIKKRQPE
jgi:SAM-dependent methyltransferase